MIVTRCLAERPFVTLGIGIIFVACHPINHSS